MLQLSHVFGCPIESAEVLISLTPSWPGGSLRTLPELDQVFATRVNVSFFLKLVSQPPKEVVLCSYIAFA